eukprot:g14048.t1 g14048   contig9:1047017-1050019(+)
MADLLQLNDGTDEGVEVNDVLLSAANLSSEPTTKRNGSPISKGSDDAPSLMSKFTNTVKFARRSVSSPPSMSATANTIHRVDSPFDEAEDDAVYSSDLFKDETQVTSSRVIRPHRTSSLELSPAPQDGNAANATNGTVTDTNNGVTSKAVANGTTSSKPLPSSPSTPSPGYYTTKPVTHIFATPLSFSLQLREFRHNSCLMTPISAVVLFAILLSSFAGLLFTLPQLVLGIFLGPLLKRNMWLVEFLYRYDIARWGHIKIMEIAGKAKNGGTSSKGGGKKNGKVNNQQLSNNPRKRLEQQGLLGHSDTVYQRITVVPGRVYVHPIPQFMDNLAYLIVCCPPKGSRELPVIGVLVDCGEANKVLAYLEVIYDQYYERDYPQSKQFSRGYGIELYAVLCTHRHHDHTAGVGDLLGHLRKSRDVASSSQSITVSGGSTSNNGQCNVYDKHGNVAIVGGAVEHVPHCNLFVRNKCFVPLPCISIHSSGVYEVNDMNAIVSIEVIAVPSHTRGSVVYALRNRVGGGGVPFEADLELTGDNFIKNPKGLKSKNGSSSFRPGAGTLSMERCFTEVLTRSSGTWSSVSNQSTAELSVQTLLYPGHEYTTDLLMRQFDQKTIPSDQHWMKLNPSVFFATASHYFVSAHKRALPNGQKLLSLPTPLDKEQIVNPNFRSLKRRGEHVVYALRLWYEFGASSIIPTSDNLATDMAYNGTRMTICSPYTTIYTEDLETIVEDLRSGSITQSQAADRIELLPTRLDEKNATVMNTAAPADSVDLILISKSRLISALDSVGLLLPEESQRLEDIIALLWKQARLDDLLSVDKSDDTDIESTLSTFNEDHIELGLLKLALFGVSLNQPSPKYCRPCGSGKASYDDLSWVMTTKMKRTNGELVRHDAGTCLLCKDVLSDCPHR